MSLKRKPPYHRATEVRVSNVYLKREFWCLLKYEFAPWSSHWLTVSEFSASLCWFVCETLCVSSTGLSTVNISFLAEWPTLKIQLKHKHQIRNLSWTHHPQRSGHPVQVGQRSLLASRPKCQRFNILWMKRRLFISKFRNHCNRKLFELIFFFHFQVVFSLFFCNFPLRLQLPMLLGKQVCSTRLWIFK